MWKPICGAKGTITMMLKPLQRPAGRIWYCHRSGAAQVSPSHAGDSRRCRKRTARWHEGAVVSPCGMCASSSRPKAKPCLTNRAVIRKQSYPCHHKCSQMGGGHIQVNINLIIIYITLSHDVLACGTVVECRCSHSTASFTNAARKPRCSRPSSFRQSFSRNDRISA